MKAIVLDLQYNRSGRDEFKLKAYYSRFGQVLIDWLIARQCASRKGNSWIGNEWKQWYEETLFWSKLWFRGDRDIRRDIVLTLFWHCFDSPVANCATNYEVVVIYVHAFMHSCVHAYMRSCITSFRGNKLRKYYGKSANITL